MERNHTLLHESSDRKKAMPQQHNGLLTRRKFLQLGCVALLTSNFQIPSVRAEQLLSQETEKLALDTVLTNYYVGYAFMNEQQQLKIKEATVIDPHTETIFYVSPPMQDFVDPQNHLASIFDMYRHLQEIPLNKSFVVLEKNNIAIVWNEKQNDGTTCETDYYTTWEFKPNEFLPQNRSYSTTCDVYKINRRIGIIPNTNKNSSRMHSNLDPFADRPAYSDEHGLVLTDGITTIRGTYDFSGWDFMKETDGKEYLPVQLLYDKSILLGTPQQRIVHNLTHFAHEFNLGDKEEVACYIETQSDAQCSTFQILKDVADNPALILFVGGKNGLPHEAVEPIKEAVRRLNLIDPEVIRSWVVAECGVRAIGKDQIAFSDQERFGSDPDADMVFIQDALSFYDLSDSDKSVKDRRETDYYRLVGGEMNGKVIDYMLALLAGSFELYYQRGAPEEQKKAKPFAGGIHAIKRAVEFVRKYRASFQDHNNLNENSFVKARDQFICNAQAPYLLSYPPGDYINSLLNSTMNH